MARRVSACHRSLENFDTGTHAMVGTENGFRRCVLPPTECRGTPASTPVQSTQRNTRHTHTRANSKIYFKKLTAEQKDGVIRRTLSLVAWAAKTRVTIN